MSIIKKIFTLLSSSYSQDESKNSTQSVYKTTPTQKISPVKTRKKATTTRNPRYGKNASTIGDYKITNDGTSIDNFIIYLINAFQNEITKIAVSGLTTHTRGGSSSRKELVEDLNGKWVKPYKIGFYVTSDFLSIADLLKAESNNEEHTDSFFDRVIKPINAYLTQELKRKLPKYSNSLTASIGLGRTRMRVWISLKLPISYMDLIIHCGKDVTDYPRKFDMEFEEVVKELIANDLGKVKNIYSDYDYRYSFFRQADNRLRKKHGAALIGEGNVTQFALYTLIKKHYPNAKHEYSPTWLGNQRIDIYLPSLKLAIEYNGIQHYEPVDLFGGAEGFKATVKRDAQKKLLCEQNKVRLYEWHYSRAVNEKEVESFLAEIRI